MVTPRLICPARNHRDFLRFFGSLTCLVQGALTCLVCLCLTVGLALHLPADANAQLIPGTHLSTCTDDMGNIITFFQPDRRRYRPSAHFSITSTPYTKLDAAGGALPDSAAYWVMVQDNVTGLIWEIKHNRDGIKHYNDPQDADNTYTWYYPDDPRSSGPPGDGASTHDFLTALNNNRFGGYSDWRLPTIKELVYLVDYSIASPGPTIDAQYFPNTAASWYWSSTSNANYTSYAWLVNFYSGNGYSYSKSYNGYVRAVRGGQ